MDIKNCKIIILNKTEEYDLFSLIFSTDYSLNFLREGCYIKKFLNSGIIIIIGIRVNKITGIHFSLRFIYSENFMLLLFISYYLCIEL